MLSSCLLQLYFSGLSRHYFAVERNGTCRNFAIIEIGYVEKKWIKAAGGGHSAIACTSPDGQTRVTAKV
jgi:hypothetical protein